MNEKMSEENEDPLAGFTEEAQSEVIQDAVKEVATHDILVCGKCHDVFFFVEEFQDHKANDACKENDELKETLKDDKKPQIWAFTLWKNKKLKEMQDEEKSPTSWSIYQLWRNLESDKKDTWVKAGENIQALFEITYKYERGKALAAQKLSKVISEEDDKSELKKAILKPQNRNTRRAPRTGSDPKMLHLVEKMLSKRYNPRKRTFEYLIKWENLDAEKNSWEPIGNFQSCQSMVEEFEKNWAIQKEQQRLQKILDKKAMKQHDLMMLAEGRPQRTSKQKALTQVKQWCGSIEGDEIATKRIFSDDSDDDDSYEKRLKYEDYSSDSENDSSPIHIKRINKVVTSQNGLDKKKVDTITIPNNILIPDAKGIVRINQKQIPSLSSGVYVMSKTAGIIKLDTKASKLATSGGQTVLKVAPKIGQTSIKVIKKDVNNGTTTTATKTANILRSKPVIRNYSSRVYMQKKMNNQIAKKMESEVKDDEKFDDDSDGIEELEFPTDIPIPAVDSPPPEFTLCPLTGKVLDKNGEALEEILTKEEPSDNTETLDNLVNMAAADILNDLSEDSKKDEENTDSSLISLNMDEVKKETEMETSFEQQTSNSKTSTTDSILSTALTNANIPVQRRPSETAQNVKATVQQRAKTILNRNVTRNTPQAIITRITPGSGLMNRTKVTPGKAKEHTQIIRKRIITTPHLQSHHQQQQQQHSRSLVRRIGDTKVYTSANSGGAHQVVSTYVATPTSGTTVISMPSLMEAESAMAAESETHEANVAQMTESQENSEMDESTDATAAETTASTTDSVSLGNISLADSETPLLITGEDGTIYQVAGQNEDGQTILITQGEDGEQQCLLVAPENAGILSQAVKPAETVAPPEPEVTAPITVNTESEEPTDESQVVAQIISANPPSPGGTRKVVLMLPDGNFMMTEVTAEQFAALELDK